MFDYSTDLGETVGNLLFEDDIISLSFYVSKLLEYIPEIEHSESVEKLWFIELFKFIKFKEYCPKNNPYNWFIEVDKTINSNKSSYGENGVFESFDSEKDNYDMLLELPSVEQIKNVDQVFEFRWKIRR